jgi:hypothetical protein
MLFVIFPGAFKLLAIFPIVDSFTFPLIIRTLAFVSITIREGENSIAMLLALLKAADILVAIHMIEGSLALTQIILEFTFILATLWPLVYSVSMIQSIFPFPFVSVTICCFHIAVSMLFSLIVELSVVSETIKSLQCSLNWSIILKCGIYGLSIGLNKYSSDSSFVLLKPTFKYSTISINEASLTFTDFGSNNPFAIVNRSIWKFNWLSFFSIFV